MIASKSAYQVAAKDQRAIGALLASFKSQVVSSKLIESVALDSVSRRSSSTSTIPQIGAGRHSGGVSGSVVAVMLSFDVV